ncbi:MAG: hypothetical protein ACP5Q4_10105 [Candidatus Caldatribacteriaceae bacterium]
MQDDSFEERIAVIEQLLNRAETLLNEVLGKEEEDEEEKAFAPEDSQPELFDLFVQMLATLKEKEENMLKAPWSRWKAFQTQQVFNWEKVTLSDLLALYHLYLEHGHREKEIPIDDSFEKLLSERREKVSKIVQGKPGGLLEMSLFFQDCRDLRSTIATFLVLLDLVFHKELRMTIENQGKIYFEKNGEAEVLEKSS